MLKEMNNKILKLRQALQELIAKENNLLDPKVIAASQELDEALNDYNKLLKELNK
ncbi:aspartyl-phosphate phosphatase Spo0E family protein [Clostridium botulinum]|uniref:Aspartyl-phosphate phosphatase Spo0E family protein n=1 Tax=Clostridium botulinum TaxID=1491 RepID=A0A6B4S2R5_CLOBO|nr:MULTISPECIES: aspartyl-phosphate phosphatase Spo0E family protein [Clostridium]EES48023.1 Spo0E like sporulation regulatory protein [Clostridium botulinum E1 str. 'BoNT E Beluga']MBN1042945.1 aspartyl-phosphate phosphatase Spo0E family protein [Clostridium botulinum]MBY6760009.1 aspartyl-phosphate phosphatase Spo0E family protein [Clostridium botulinum]MBY6918918.1 aspartyl-phosphate phosphatase Spo0E family protein [Clostridium botulinum]MBY7024653.1 aspartyl-phosphate phosphatase Spo0E fa